MNEYNEVKIGNSASKYLQIDPNSSNNMVVDAENYHWAVRFFRKSWMILSKPEGEKHAYFCQFLPYLYSITLQFGGSASEGASTIL